MNYIGFILEIFCWISVSLLFINLIDKKFKLHNFRLDLQHKGYISTNINIKWITILSLFFWLFPATRYRHLNIKGHNVLLNRINRSLIGIILTLIIFILVNAITN
jgi:hypothetical protein